jgi:hypothetical protein
MVQDFREPGHGIGVSGLRVILRRQFANSGFATRDFLL